MSNFWETLGKNCINCKFFDGYDLCLYSQNEGTVNKDSIKNCPIYDNKNMNNSNNKIMPFEIRVALKQDNNFEKHKMKWNLPFIK